MGLAVLFRPCLWVDQHYSDADGCLQAFQLSSTDSDSSSFQLILLYGPNHKVEGKAFFNLLCFILTPLFLPLFVATLILLSILLWIGMVVTHLPHGHIIGQLLYLLSCGILIWLIFGIFIIQMCIIILGVE